MSSAASTIDRIALGRAATVYLSFTSPEFISDPFAGYRAFKAAVESFSNPSGMDVLPEMENNHELALELIGNLADRIGQDIKAVLDLAKEGIVNETIECRLDSDMNALDMPGLVEIGHSLESGGDDSNPVSAEVAAGPVLRRFEVGVTRVAYSSEKMVSVLGVSDEDASARALELAYDMDFSCTDGEYECSVSGRNAEALKSGDVVTWRDPEGGEEQDVIFRESHGEIMLCHTIGGGEVEVFPHELH